MRSWRASSSVCRILSPPGTSPTPVFPASSFRMTMLRVKKGPCAPLRFINMLSWPATGITCSSVTTGASRRLAAVLDEDMSILLGSLRPRIERSEVQGNETSPLVLLCDWVQWIRLLQNLCGEILAILFWLIAELLCTGVVPVTARVVRDAPHGHIADVGNVYALHHQVHQILGAKPRAQLAELCRRLAHRSADAHGNALDAVLVPVHARHRLAPDLRQAVKAVGPKRRIELELVLDRMHAEGVVRAGEDHAPHLVAARTFVDLVQADEIVLDDLRQRPLDTCSRQVNQHVDAIEQAIDDGGIAQIAVHDVLALMQRRQRIPAPRRAQIDTAFLELSTKNPAHIARGSG